MNGGFQIKGNYLDLLAYFGIGGAHPGGLDLTKTVLDAENILSSDHVLDLGCGTGQTSAYLARQYNCHVTAIDNHPVMLEKSNHRFQLEQLPVRVINGNAEKLALQDDSFDYVFSESVVIFTDITKTLNELSRVLKKDGKLILIEMIAEHALTEELKSDVCELYGIKKILNEDEWKISLQDAGFKQIEILKQQSAELINTEIQDLNQSKDIRLEFYDLWDQHHQLIHQYRNILSYRVFRCLRS